MAKFAVMQDGKVWVDVNSLVLDISSQVNEMLDKQDPPHDAIDVLLMVGEELIELRDKTISVSPGVDTPA